MSFTNDCGGALTLPSPTHVHHDVSSAVRSLRRSLSRSPSKFRLSGAVSPTPAAPASFRQSPTPSRSAHLEHPASTPIPATPAALAGPSSPTSFSAPQQGIAGNPFVNKPNIKLSVRSTRSKPLTRPLSRSRGSPKSPLKRVFGPSTDCANLLPTSLSAPEARGQENKSFREFALALSPASRRNLEKHTRHSVHLDISGSSKAGVAKFHNHDPFPAISVSPLKRSDATMSLGQTASGSPVAKRRSLHGISSMNNESTVFDPTPAAQESQQQSFDIHEDANLEYELTGLSESPTPDPLASPTPSSMQHRSNSLRRSTLQQRHGDFRPSWGRRAGERAQMTMEAASPVAGRSRPRLSLDQYVPVATESPFTHQGPLPPPSAHFLPPKAREHTQPHPLSRSLTQSSSNSSLPDDSPTHVPAHIGEKPRVPLNFSKSLPYGARPPIKDSADVATPNYRQAKPFQAAFMSTGLVSKMNRNPELGPPKHPGAKVNPMPDTPCKKQASYSSATYPPNHSAGRRQSRMSCVGSPSTPFSSNGAPPTSSLFFQQVRANHARKSSLLSLDGDEFAASLDDFPPPTPTKNIFKHLTSSAQNSRTPDGSPLFATPAVPFSLSSARTPAQTTTPSFTPQGAPQSTTPSFTPPGAPSFTPPGAPHDQGEGQQTTEPIFRPSTPFSNGSPSVSASAPTISTGSQTSHTPATLFATPAPRTKTTPVLFQTTSHGSNHYLLPTVDASGSPLGLKTDSPRTPGDSLRNSMPPPGGKSTGPPATPSTHERSSLFGPHPDRRMSITPRNGHGPSDIDESLVERFDKSEVIGSGEFSTVYRVTKLSSPTLSFMTMGLSTTPRTPSSPDSGRVYAVKKLRVPIGGGKERERRYQEVHILRSLTHSSKVVQYMDSWEWHNHLYIQTEFCTEGSLDIFLKDIGQMGRLDDFRIWKIMLEISQGLAAIHEAGFIHLDIKPANVLVTFDGYLKIADFGLATTSPAPAGIEGEGDREYIGPEILRGRYEQPADIFALGLIILEIACNVFLPDNGPTWQALRIADMSAVPSLTSPEAGSIIRDANGVPIEHLSPVQEDRRNGDFPFEGMTHDPKNLFSPTKRAELSEPPSFMTDREDPHSLDKIVTWMIQPEPNNRPTAQQILASEPVSWVASCRSGGATVYEGNWGPQVGPSIQELIDDDTEMTDV
ncbi:putative mitosis inhibitor protein kinase [Triangularia verruculosa]|uniref:Mitosis inhibitor protein kinase n=1 Tax=Triangularia verruculosa TaxID=2587418 RepID=A0AAN7AVY9_9PEZI|nr:putative mitosis inhibitor protein kinase [Triangularia verruculosa]